MKIAIVGGGMVGLPAALDLSAAGHRVTVYEKYPELGGLAGTFDLNGSRLERFYHHVFSTDLDFIGLAGELGVGDRLQWFPESIGSYHGGRIHSLSPAWKLLFFSGLPFFDRLRMALVCKGVSLRKSPLPYEEVTAKEFILRTMGERVWTVMWEPLFRSKFGAFADEISMTWLYGRLRARFGPAQPGVPKGRLGYLRGSVQVLVDALADRLRASGADLRVSTPVRRIAVEDGRAVGVETREGLERHDRVLCSAATPQFLKMTEGSLPPELERALARFRYLGSVVAVLEMSRPSGPAYWVNILDPGIPILAVVEQTRMIGPEHYGGRHVLYVSRYVDREDPCFRAKDAEILEGWYPHLEKVLPDFDRSGILRARVMRADYTQPIVDRGYGRRIPAHRMPVRDLYLANMTQIYPEDRGMNYSIRLGRKVARMIHEDSRG